MDISQQLAVKILSQLSELFNEDCENHISIAELNKNNQVTEFFHALLNIAPAMMYIQITRNEVDLIEINHIANRLVFQYTEKDSVSG